MNNETSQVFWLEDWEGNAKSGVFVRCNLNPLIKEMNLKGSRVVGIKIDLSEKWTLELFLEEGGDSK
jgi:hypothetical protein